MEVASTSKENKIALLKIVFKKITYCLMEKVPDKDAKYGLIEVDQGGNLVETEGCENLDEASWVYLKKILTKYKKHTEIAECVARTILTSNPEYKIPYFVEECLDSQTMAHAFLKYRRLENAANSLLRAIKNREYIDPILLAKVCESLRLSGKEEYKQLLSQLNPLK